MLAAVLMAAIVCLGSGLPAAAQGLFAPRVLVNDQAITEFEIRQRVAMLGALGMDDSRQEAIDRLIEERLMREAGTRAGVRVTRAEIEEGLSEFASRYEMTLEEFMREMAGAGIEASSLRDFVESGLMWRRVARREVGGRITVTDADVERAMQTAAVRAVARVRLAEIVLPTDPRFADAVAQIVPRIQAITTAEEFSLAASQASLSPTRDQGGLMADWLPMTNFPPPLARAIEQARINEVIGPIDLPGGEAIVLLQLRGRDTVRNIPAGRTLLRYARVAIPGGRSEAAQQEAARLAAQADGCRELPGIAARGPSGEVVFIEEFQTQLAQGVAIELARLNPGGSSVSLVEGDNLLFLMLCSRELRVEGRPTREQMRERLFNERAAALTEGLMARLRADAHIIQR